MQYTIGEVSKRTGIPISTLRYYDREGMFPGIKRGNGGIRSFSDEELSALEVVECLKSSGLSIKDIKQFLQWCEEGNASLEKRRELFYKQREEMLEYMAKLQDTLNMLEYKCWYYDTALAAGDELAPRDVDPKDIPAHIRHHKKEPSN